MLARAQFSQKIDLQSLGMSYLVIGAVVVSRCQMMFDGLYG